MNFEINLPNYAIFLLGQNFKTKIDLSLEKKEILRWNKRHFSVFLKGFQLSKIDSDLRVHLQVDNL